MGRVTYTNKLWDAWKRIDPGLSLAGYIYAFLIGTTAGAGMIAWASTTWTWYWRTLSWAGIGIAFLIAFFVISLSIYLISLAASH